MWNKNMTKWAVRPLASGIRMIDQLSLCFRGTLVSQLWPLQARSPGGGDANADTTSGDRTRFKIASGCACTCRTRTRETTFKISNFHRRRRRRQRRRSEDGGTHWVDDARQSTLWFGIFEKTTRSKSLAYENNQWNSKVAAPNPCLIP